MSLRGDFLKIFFLIEILLHIFLSNFIILFRVFWLIYFWLFRSASERFSFAHKNFVPVFGWISILIAVLRWSCALSSLNRLIAHLKVLLHAIFICWSLGLAYWLIYVYLNALIFYSSLNFEIAPCFTKRVLWRVFYLFFYLLRSYNSLRYLFIWVDLLLHLLVWWRFVFSNCLLLQVLVWKCLCMELIFRKLIMQILNLARTSKLKYFIILLLCFWLLPFISLIDFNNLL